MFPFFQDLQHMEPETSSSGVIRQWCVELAKPRTRSSAADDRRKRKVSPAEREPVLLLPDCLMGGLYVSAIVAHAKLKLY